MFPQTPPPHPDEHLMHEENRREALERDDKSGQTWQRQKSLSKGDKVIFLVLGVALLLVLVFLLSAVLAS